MSNETNLQRIERTKLMADAVTEIESDAEFELICQLEDRLCDLIQNYKLYGAVKNATE